MATNPQIRIIDLPLETDITTTALNEFVAIESSVDGGRRISVPALLSGGQNLYVPLPGTTTDSNAGVAGVSTDNAVVRYNGTRGLIQNSTATLDDGGNFVATSYTSTSSERYKKNILPLKNALEIVQQLNGVSFTWKDENLHGSERDIGLIAEHVEKILPEIVYKNTSGEVVSLEYGKIVALLINAIKELKQEVDALKK